MDIHAFPEKSDISIGISSCLLGERVRYDTGHKQHSYICHTLGNFFTFRPFCPEMAIGLGTPRETIRLVNIEGETRAVGTKTAEHDVTQALRENGEAQAHWQRELYGYILKKDSPSCGMERVKVYKKNTPEKVGVGLYAEALLKNNPLLPVEEEGRLGDAVLRENFIKRVYSYRSWRSLVDSGVSMKKLTDFHSAYKYSLLSHNQNETRKLGSFLAEAHTLKLEEVVARYSETFMAILKRKASKRNHVNVLQHLQGFLKTDLDKADRQELGEAISEYRLGRLPLIVPIVLLRHHFRRHPKPFVDRCTYLNPHPGELMLLNTL